MTPPRHDDGRPDAVQRGLPGVAREEDPLPSERALSGELLCERFREARAGLQRVLGACPEGFSAEEWRVVQSLLCPPPAPPGTLRGRGILMHRARECFPGYAAPAALRMYIAARDRPHLAEFVADFRSLEAIDIMEQRGLWRERLDLAGSIVEVLRPPPGVSIVDHLAGMDIGTAAKIATAVASVAKQAADFDGLRAPAPGRASSDDDGDAASNSLAEDPRASIADRIAKIAEDLIARRGPNEGVVC